MGINGRCDTAAALIREPGASHLLLESILHGVVACDANGRLTLFNPAAREWFGEDFIGISIDEWAGRHDYYCDDGSTVLPVADTPLVRALRGEKITGEGVVIAIAGQPVRFFHVSGGPIQDSQGRLCGTAAMLCDLTSLWRKTQGTAELESSNRNLRAALDARQREAEWFGRKRTLLRCILDSVNDLIFIKDPDSVYRGCNRSAGHGDRETDALRGVDDRRRRAQGVDGHRESALSRPRW